MSLDTSNDDRHIHGRRGSRIASGAIAVLITITVYMSWSYYSSPRIPEGLGEQEYRTAAARWKNANRSEPDHTEVLMTAGELALRRNDPETAMAAFGGVSDNHPQYGAIARFQEAQAMLQLNLARAAEFSYRKFLSLAENNPGVSVDLVLTARKWLCFLLSTELRIDERREFLAASHAAGKADIVDSKQYYFPRLLIWKSTSGRIRFDEFYHQDNSDLVLNITLARYLSSEGKLKQSLTLLKSIEQTYPDNLECKAAMLECYFETNDWNEISRTLQSVSAYTVSEPHVITWIRAELALHNQRWNDAVIEFERALKSDPTDPAVHMGLGKAFGQLEQFDRQKESQRASLVLAQIRVDMARVDGQSPDAVWELANRCRQIGLDEAAATFEWHAKRIRSQEDGQQTSKE